MGSSRRMIGRFSIVVIVFVSACATIKKSSFFQEMKSSEEGFKVWFSTGFSGEKAILNVDGKKVFSGELRTLSTIGFSEEVIINSKKNISTFEVIIPELSLCKRFKVDWRKGKLVLIGLENKQILIAQELKPFLLY